MQNDVAESMPVRLMDKANETPHTAAAKETIEIDTPVVTNGGKTKKQLSAENDAAEQSAAFWKRPKGVVRTDSCRRWLSA